MRYTSFQTIPMSRKGGEKQQASFRCILELKHNGCHGLDEETLADSGYAGRQKHNKNLHIVCDSDALLITNVHAQVLTRSLCSTRVTYDPRAEYI